jgi:hypothetical protein
MVGLKKRRQEPRRSCLVFRLNNKPEYNYFTMRLPLTLSLPRGNAHAQDLNNDAAIISDESSGELVLIELQGQLELTIEGENKQDKEDAVHVHPDGQRIGKLDMSVPVC